MSARDYYSEWKVCSRVVCGKWQYDVYRTKFDRRGKKFDSTIYWDTYDTLKEAMEDAADLNGREVIR